jgi:3-dehydrosphinganine reductase
MYTPGYEEEMKSKPEITKKIEESDTGLTSEQAASAMLSGKAYTFTDYSFEFLISPRRCGQRYSAYLW